MVNDEKGGILTPRVGWWVKFSWHTVQQVALEPGQCRNNTSVLTWQTVKEMKGKLSHMSLIVMIMHVRTCSLLWLMDPLEGFAGLLERKK